MLQLTGICSWRASFLPVVLLLISCSAFCNAYRASNKPYRIDCGSTTASIVDGIEWSADEYFQNGKAYAIAANPSNGVNSVEATLRAFPPLKTGCYHVPLAIGRYLVRVGLAYHNYDSLGEPPLFNIVVNGLVVKTVVMAQAEAAVPRGGLYLDFLTYALQNSISVCVEPFAGVTKGPPFLNSLEFLPADTESYDKQLIGEDAILATALRVNLGGPKISGFPVDPGYRYWIADEDPANSDNFTTISTSQIVSSTGRAPDYLPYEIFQTARRASESSGVTAVRIDVDPVNPLHLFYARIYFAEIEGEVKGGERIFDILLGSNSIFGQDDTGNSKGFEILAAANGTTFKPVMVPVFFNYSVYSQEYGQDVILSFVRASTSLRPPIISALELYEIVRTPEDGYLVRGLTPNDWAAIAVFTLLGALIMGVGLYCVALRLHRSGRRYAIFGAGRQSPE